MDNSCGGGGQRLPPDGDEFPAAYNEYLSGQKSPYSHQYNVTKMPSKDQVDGYLAKNLEISSYFSKETTNDSSDNNEPPPLPLTEPPSKLTNELWRQDNKSEKSVKDKIAMFSSQSSIEAPLFPTGVVVSSPVRRLAKHKSSDDVFLDDKRSSPPLSPSYSPSYKQYSSISNSDKQTNGLTRTTSFSGQTVTDSVANLARTNSLASTFKRSVTSEDARKTSLNQLIEQRRKGFSKLRGLVIPEKDAVPVDQPIIDLPEIKSRDSILSVSKISRTNIQDKWGSQNSLISNASTVSSSIRTSNGVSSFKMPAPKILSNYSPAFKRKSLSNYNNGNINNNQTNSLINGTKKNNESQQLNSPASDAPKSLESICSPTRSDYSFDFVSSSGNGSPDNQTNKTDKINSNNNKLNGQQRKLGRNELYDDSDNDSAVSSSQSSISRGFSPPMSPVPSDRSTISSERSYLSSETSQRSPQLILDKNQTFNQARANFLVERSFSINENKCKISQRPICESRRVLKPQSVEAINRKNILASARCRSGRDLNGSPLIQRKFSDDDDPSNNTRVDFVNTNGINDDGQVDKPEIKIAYIEITENIASNGDKFVKDDIEEHVDDDVDRKPKLPPKRSVIPQSKNTPIPSSRPPKPEPLLEPSNDMKSWVRAEMRSLTEQANSYDTRKKAIACDTELNFNGNRNFTSKPIDHDNDIELIDTIKPKPRSIITMKKTTEHEDLLTVLTTKSRSRSAIHVEETSYGKLKSQMSLEDILAVKSPPLTPTKLPRSQSVTTESKVTINNSSFSSTNHERPNVRRSNSTESWSDEKNFTSKIPSLGRTTIINKQENMTIEETLIETSEHMKSKIPMPRNLGKRSSSVTDMKKVFEKAELSSSSGTSSPGGQSITTASHNRFPSLDSSIEENIRPVGICEVDQERFSGEQFGSISSLASSTSLISQQELAQLVEEANLEEPRGGHDVVVVLLHKENPTGSVGITLAGGMDCETKEITIHRVLSHSIADKEGSVQRGDRILSINGRSMRGLTHRESLTVLKQPRSEVVLVVSRAKIDDNQNAMQKLKTRAESVETIVEGYETNGHQQQQSTTASDNSNSNIINTAWGPSSMVTLYKDGSGLGFSLEGGRDSPLGDRPLLIKKIFTGGAAEKTGALRAGDQLLEVNKRDVSRMSRIEAWSLMKKLPDGEVNLLVRHPATKSS